MVVLGVPSGCIEPHRAHTGSRSFRPRVAAVITASARTCQRMTSLQINCPSMSFGVNIVSLGRKLMIGKRQKCAEPPGEPTGRAVDGDQSWFWTGTSGRRRMGQYGGSGREE